MEADRPNIQIGELKVQIPSITILAIRSCLSGMGKNETIEAGESLSRKMAMLAVVDGDETTTYRLELNEHEMNLMAAYFGSGGPLIREIMGI